MSCSASTITARSYCPYSDGSAASRAWNVTRSATPASGALARASAIAGSSRSKPSTVVAGYPRAIETAAHPTPHATSATRAPALSFACTSGTCGRYSVANEPTSHGRLKSPCASTCRPPPRRRPRRSGRRRPASGARPRGPRASGRRAPSRTDSPDRSAPRRARPEARSAAPPPASPRRPPPGSRWRPAARATRGRSERGCRRGRRARRP